MRVQFQYFRSAFGSWETLFQKAADFASRIPRDRLIAISHSADGTDGVVTVWYWGEDVLPEE